MDSSKCDSELAKRQSPTPCVNRLASLDILRGFDMFWIIGGGSLLAGIISFLGWQWLMPISKHLEHVEWDGFHAWDLIFPLFIFVSGVAMPFSFEKQLLTQQKHSLYFKVIKRAIILILLGFFCNSILKTLDLANTRYLSVLGLIGMAYLWASIVVINLKPIGQAIYAVAILLIYCAVMNLIPVPGYGAGILTPEGNFASFIDRLIVPGKFYNGVHDPEGLLMNFPASVLAVSGALAGALLKKQNISQYRKFIFLAVAGIVCLGVGLCWGGHFPMIKKLWTSSFVVYAIGWSLLLLALFYLVVDIWGIKKIFFPFMLIGVNPLTIYVCSHGLINFGYTSESLFGGLTQFASDPFKPAIHWLGILICELVFLYILYRRKIFLKV